MKVALTRNIGRKTVAELGLVKSPNEFKPEDFLVGTVHDFDGETLKALQAAGLVEEPKPQVKAVPKEAGIK